ncbi:MAG TPA: hypothetical protein VHU91_09820 [Mycobacteriales bacterium]|jgi:hypothetical protein|nr:hypothetical protein [Mycobacteriales bacterium]
MATATAEPSAVTPELPPYPEKGAFRDRGRVRIEVFNADADMQERLADRVEAALREPKFDSVREMRVNALLPEVDRRASLYFIGQDAVSPRGKSPEYHPKYHATKVGRKELRKKVKKLDKLLSHEKSWWGEHNDAVFSAGATFLFTYVLGEYKGKPTRLSVGIQGLRNRIRSRNRTEGPFSRMPDPPASPGSGSSPTPYL